MKQTASFSLWTLWGGYCVVMLWLLFGQRLGGADDGAYLRQVADNLNLIPFHTLGTYWTTITKGGRTPYLVYHAIINLAGNVVLFVPLGLFLPALWRKLRRFFRFFLTVTGLIALVEVLQLLTLLGSGDVDDLILNVLGASLGFGLYQLLQRGQARCKK